MVSLSTHICVIRPQWIYNAYLQTVAYWNVCYVYVSNMVFSKWRLGILFPRLHSDVHLHQAINQVILLKKCSRDAEPWLPSWFRNNEQSNQTIDWIGKLNTFFITVFQSWNRFSNIVNVTIIGMARPKNLPLDKLVGEIRVTTDIISS